MIVYFVCAYMRCANRTFFSVVFVSKGTQPAMVITQIMRPLFVCANIKETFEPCVKHKFFSAQP